jgi:hypothetical protein
MLPHPEGGVLTVGGWFEGDGPSDAIYYLPKFDGTWIKIEKVLSTPRYYHTALWVPNSVVECPKSGVAFPANCKKNKYYDYKCWSQKFSYQIYLCMIYRLRQQTVFLGE